MTSHQAGRRRRVGTAPTPHTRQPMPVEPAAQQQPTRIPVRSNAAHGPTCSCSARSSKSAMASASGRQVSSSRSACKPQMECRQGARSRRGLDAPWREGARCLPPPQRLVMD